MSIRTLLVDDHTLMRQGIKRLLENSVDIDVVGEASNGIEAIVKTRELLPDVVILDIAMPQMGGIAAIKEIMKESSDTNILVLSAHADKHIVQQAFQAGVKGYVEKGVSFLELENAIRAVTAGKTHLSGDITDVVIKAFLKKDDAVSTMDPMHSLSTRELQIVRLLSEGQSTKEIAYELKISPRTVDAHKQHIMVKLKINTLAGLIKWAIRQGIITVD